MDEIKIKYLYVKTHNKTGLKYLGQTEQDPYKYRGSGKYWVSHIKKYGNDVTTEILKECKTQKEVKKWGLYYSELFDVVKSKEWANLMEEDGYGMSSEQARIINQRRLADGTHPFLDKEAARRNALKRVAAGTHNFLDKEARERENQRRIANEVGWWSKKNKKAQQQRSLDRVAKGIHPWQNREWHRKQALERVANRTHNFLQPKSEAWHKSHKKAQQNMMADGTHNYLKLHECPHCGHIGNGPLMFRWHFQNCKLISVRTQTVNTYTCPHCGKVGKGPVMFRYHFHKCKSKKN